MPKAGMNQDQKSYSVFDQPTFKLKKDEKARIVVLETEFLTEFTHWVDETGYVICMGDYKTMLETGMDLEHCAFCKASEQYKAIGKGRRKFVTPIIQYRTSSKGEVLTPVSFDIKLWLFGDDKFNDLVNKKEEWKDLRPHDIVCECLGEQYQKFRMDVAREAVWLKDATLKAQVAAAFLAFRKQYQKDFPMLLGRNITEPQRIAEIIHDAAGIVQTPEYVSPEEVTNLFSDVAAGSALPGSDFADLLGDTAHVPTPTPQAGAGKAKSKVESKAETKASVATVSPGEVNFDDLLS